MDPQLKLFMIVSADLLVILTSVVSSVRGLGLEVPYHLYALTEVNQSVPGFIRFIFTGFLFEPFFIFKTKMIFDMNSRGWYIFWTS